MCGCSSAYIRMLELGVRERLSGRLLLAMAKVLEVEPQWLLTGEGSCHE